MHPGRGAILADGIQEPLPGASPLLEPARRIDVLSHLSGAFDLADSRETGHAARVAWIASEVARVLRLDDESRSRIVYAGLLHDAGVAVRAGKSHLEAGAWVASRFGLGDDVTTVIQASHERWDGHGRPRGLATSEIPVEALAVIAGHWTDDEAAAARHPLRARAELQRFTLADLEPVLGRTVAEALLAVLRRDETWMTLWSSDLPARVAAITPGGEPSSIDEVERTAAAMGEVVDAALRETGRSARVAVLAGALATELGLDEEVARAVRIAGYVLDVGQLGVPQHITQKPAILSVEEMELMRRHPGLGSRMLKDAPGLGPVAPWVDAHHERPDGRGYPEMLTRDELELPPLILGVADTYCALRAERPYRAALSEEDALALIQAGAGAQNDEAVADVLPRCARVYEQVVLPEPPPRRVEDDPDAEQRVS